MQGKTQTEDVRIVQPTGDKPGEYRVKMGNEWVDFTNPDLFQEEQWTLEPVRLPSGVVWTPTDR